ncbi:MAG: PilZ domain-containing protein [Armatimonadota bacterium]|nr:PilZ domain-containing protein [Armatimonadota bacterium]
MPTIPDMEYSEISCPESGAFTVRNRRVYVRYKVDLTAAVWPAGEEDEPRQKDTMVMSCARTAVVDNMSLSGTCFITRGLFRPGTLLWIRLRLGAQTYQIKAIVRRFTPQQVTGHRCYAYGVQFVRSEQTPVALAAIARFLQTVRQKLPEFN